MTKNAIISMVLGVVCQNKKRSVFCLFIYENNYKKQWYFPNYVTENCVSPRLDKKIIIEITNFYQVTNYSYSIDIISTYVLNKSSSLFYKSLKYQQ